MAKSQKRAGKGEPKKILADTMNTVEMAAHRRKNGIVLLPVGCFEMHGVQLGLGCDTFEAYAACRILAEEWDAVVMPPIYFTYSGATAPWPGTVSIMPDATVAYLVAVTKAILKTGFKRVVLVSIHGPSDWYISMALRSIFEETGELPIMFKPKWEEFWRQVEKEYGQPYGSEASYLAALYICGRHGEFDPHATEAEALPRTIPVESLRALSAHGAVAPYRYVRPEDHVGRHAGLEMDDAPRLAEIFREAILEAARGLPEDYAKYQQDMWEAIKEAPWDKL